MTAKYRSYRHGDLEYYRFSVYFWGSNMQTVYAFRLGGTLIDTGHAKSRRNLFAALGGRPVHTVLLTHHHEDHAGNAAAVQQAFGADVLAHTLGAEWLNRGVRVSPLGLLISGSVPKVRATAIVDGQEIVREGFRLRAIHTPGHTDDHLAFHEPDRGWLFPGDLYVADRIKYFESNEEIDVQIASLRRLVALDFDALFCSHNPKVSGGKERLQRKLQLFEDFYGEVANLYRRGMNATEILAATGRRENRFYLLVTAGHFTAVNMVKSVIRSLGS